jgi:hypothetical protein
VLWSTAPLLVAILVALVAFAARPPEAARAGS